MAFSGLALAGANRGLRGDLGPAQEDGILYALEILDLNLHGTELITLSACETGLGMLDYSEGVYGLARAFRITGARNVLMALWPVEDAFARAFMLIFYRYWLEGGMTDAAQALDHTRQAFLMHPKLPWRDPEVWASFSLIESN